MAENSGVQAGLDSAGKVLGEAAGHAIVTIASEFGKTLISYWHRNLEGGPVERAQSVEDADLANQLPPYAIVGIGRCGTHVSAELAGMLLDGNEGGPTLQQGIQSFARRIFGRAGGPPLRVPNPMLVVGDIDETTFEDLDKILAPEKERKGLSGFRKLHYKPLAHGGAGHVPAFGEFLTRGLMLLSPYDKSNQARPWENARRYLIESCSGGSNAPRLVFYLFSAGGGTGSGAAAELVRTQRVAINMSAVTDPELYLTGITVVPRGLISAPSRRHLINTGRLFVQYLAELNLSLEGAESYIEAQRFKFGYFTTDKTGRRDAVRPWDSLGIVSNEILAPLAEEAHDKAERVANRYIAQQVFSMAASQVRSEKKEEEDGSEEKKSKLPDINVNDANFRSTRLDPHDLKTALRGPYAIGFSTAMGGALNTIGGVDRMFLRAIGLPAWNNDDAEAAPNLINGLSILPTEERELYADLMQAIRSKVEVNQHQVPSLPVRLTRTDLQGLGDIVLFSKCPRVVFVVGHQSDTEFKAGVADRVCELLSWIMPNLNEARYAIVQHDLEYTTLSVFLQSSVLLCPELRKAVENYVKLCWARRPSSAKVFKQEFEDILTRNPPITDDEIATWLGPMELYGKNIDGFDSDVSELDARWRNFVNVNVDGGRKAELLKHTVQDCMLNPSEVAAALRFLNYVNKFGLAEVA